MIKRLPTMTLLFAFSSVPFLGCEEASDKDLLVERLDELARESNDQVEILCACSDELGHESVPACKTATGEILPAMRRCIDDAFAQDIETSQQYIDCLLPLEREFTRCIDEKLACDDLTSAEACTTDRATGLENCITLPQSTQRPLDECFDGD